MDSPKLEQKRPYQAPALTVLGNFEKLTQTGGGGHPGHPHFPWHWHWKHHPKGGSGDPGGPDLFS